MVVTGKLRSCVAGLVSVALSLSPVVDTFAWAQDVTRADIEACKSQDETAFRKAIAEITTNSLNASLATIDYEALVTQEWREGDVGKIIDDRVDIAVKEVREQTSWGNLLKSLAYREEAQKLATEVANRVYRADAVTQALENLASDVGREVGERMEFAAQDASKPALRCLKAYLGPRYGDTVSKLVGDDARRDFALDAEGGTASITPGAVLQEAGGGATGVAILIVRRQLANLARTVGQRIVGAVLARLVSVVAGGVGLVLIAKDIWDFRHGVLPIIEGEMKSEETKEKVRSVLAETISTQIGKHVEEIGATTADRVLNVWRQFRSAHLRALQLADENAEFRSFLETVPANRLGRLDEVVGLVLADGGESDIVRRLENGSLNAAVTQLPEPAMQIARATRSLEKGLRWHALAGEDVAQVLEHGIYRETSPDDFTPAMLRRLLALDDGVAIVRIAALPRAARASLFELDTEQLKGLARSLTSEELAQLAGYLTGLEPAARSRILHTVAETPAKLKLLARDRVRQAVLRSPDQSAAVNMMLRADNGFSPTTTFKDIQLVIDGRVSPMLLIDKHPIALGVGVLVLIMLLFMLRRLFFAPRSAKPASDEA